MATEAAACAQDVKEAAPPRPPAPPGSAALLALLVEDVLPRARVAAQRALELDPNQAEAYVAVGSVNLFYDWNWEAAGQSARRALELSPNSASAHLLYSNYSVFLASFEGAIREAQEAEQLDPASLLMNRNLAFVYQPARRYPDYAAQARATQARSNLATMFSGARSRVARDRKSVV